MPTIHPGFGTDIAIASDIVVESYDMWREYAHALEDFDDQPRDLLAKLMLSEALENYNVQAASDDEHQARIAMIMADHLVVVFGGVLTNDEFAEQVGDTVYRMHVMHRDSPEQS